MKMRGFNLHFTPAWLLLAVLCAYTQISNAAPNATNKASVTSQALSAEDKKKVNDLLDKAIAAGTAARVQVAGTNREAAFAESSKVNSEVREALVGMGPRIIPYLLEVSSETKPQSTLICSSVLNLFGPLALESLLQLVKEGNPLSTHAAFALQKMGSNAVPGLLVMLRDRSNATRESAADVLAGMTPDHYYLMHHPKMVFDLADIDQICKAAASDQDALVRGPLVTLLGKIGPREPAVLDTLKRALLQDPEATVRTSAVKAVIVFMHLQNPLQNGPCLQLMADSLGKDEYEGVRQEAARALASSRAEPQIAVPALVGALDDHYASVVSAALFSLATYGVAAAPSVPNLVKIIEADQSDQRSNLAMEAARVLTAIGPSAEAALPALERVMNSGDSNRQAIVIPAIASIKGDGYVPNLAHLIKDDNAGVRDAAVRSLGSLASRSESAANLLKELEKSSDPQERAAAAEASGMIRRGR